MIEPGWSYVERRTFSQGDFDRFARLSGDDNPIHVDPGFAAHTRFGQTVAHGMLLYTAIAGVLERALPGAEQLSQELMFPTPTYADEEVQVRLEVLETDEGSLALSSLITGAGGKICCEGRMVIRLPTGEAS